MATIAKQGFFESIFSSPYKIKSGKEIDVTLQTYKRLLVNLQKENKDSVTITKTESIIEILEWVMCK